VLQWLGMQAGQPYKQCPRCGTTSALNAPQCTQCGHGFSTQFTPPNQTQAFHRMGEGPGMPYQPQPGYLPVGAPFDFNSFILGFPPVVCFLLGFFVHIIGFVLLVFYFGNPPTKNPQLGWATAWGIIASIVVLIGFFILMMLPAMFMHG